MCRGITISQRIRNYESEISDLKRYISELQGGCALKEATIVKDKLTASQAREARLREFSLDQWWYSELKSLLDFPEITDDAKRVIIGVIPNLIGQIQAPPHDDIALKEYRDTVIEECATHTEEEIAELKQNLDYWVQHASDLSLQRNASDRKLVDAERDRDFWRGCYESQADYADLTINQLKAFYTEKIAGLISVLEKVNMWNPCSTFSERKINRVVNDAIDQVKGS